MVVQNPLTGRSRGKYGNSVFTTQKGQNIVKTKPEVVANPKTEGQINQRAKLALAVLLANAVMDIIYKGFNEKLQKLSQFNQFVKVNFAASFATASAGVATLVPANFKISKGSIGTTNFGMTLPDAGETEVFVSFDTIPPANGSGSDKVLLAIYNATKNEWAMYTGSNTRSIGEAGVNFPSAVAAGNVLHVYLGFCSADLKKASDSIHQTGTAQA